MRIILHAGLHKTGASYVQSMWQERVKQGSPLGQVEDRENVSRGAVLRPGSLARLVSAFGCDDVRVRLVRPNPREENLPHGLLQIADVEFDEGLTCVGENLN